MPLYRNDKEKIDMHLIPNYIGQDEFMQQLHDAYVDIHKRFFSISKDTFITFLHPKMKTGRLKGRAQESWPFVGTIKTSFGDERLRYCKSAVQGPNGLLKFDPANLVMTSSTFRLGINDTDQILFLMVAFSPYKRGLIKMVDERADAEKKSFERGRSTHVNYHIFNEFGDLYADKDKLVKFCQAWGIATLNRFPDQLKNELADKIEAAEKARDFDYGYEAFQKALKENDPNFEVKVLVHKALERQVIHHYKKSYQVQFANQEVFVKIPPQDDDKWQRYLINFLSNNPEKYEQLVEANGDMPVRGLEKFASRQLIQVPDNPTKEFFEGLEWFKELRPLYIAIKGTPYEEQKSITKKMALEGCIEYFVTQGKKLP